MPSLVRTTLTLPGHLLEEADAVVRLGGARSRNELVVEALRRELAFREREAIDAEFADMGQDEEVQAEAELIARQFEGSDWHAFQEAERRP